MFSIGRQIDCDTFMARAFLAASSSAQDQITGLYDFVWPTAAALWNLRWQVNGYIVARPNAGVDELQARFIEGSGIRGANLRRACIEHGWDDQQEKLAEVLLTNLFAIYEGWEDEVRTKSKPHLGDCLAAKCFQIPSKAKEALNKLESADADEAAKLFWEQLRREKMYDPSLVQNWLKCYRYFKELRNDIVHQGGRAGKWTVDTYNAFKPIATPVGLGVKEVPLHLPVSVEGQQVRLHLRGVVGFSDILRRLIITIDCEFLRSDAAGPLLVERLKDELGDLRRESKGKQGSKLESLIRGRLKGSSLPVPQDVKAIVSTMRCQHII